MGTTHLITDHSIVGDGDRGMEQVIEDYMVPLGTATHPKNWDWGSLANPSRFVWNPLTTPLGHPAVIVVTWGVYLTVVFGLKAVVGARWNTRAFSILHNAGLCGVSFGMLAVILWYMGSALLSGHWQRVFCWRGNPGDGVPSPTAEEDATLVWVVAVYYYTKWWELLDTVLLALTLKPLIFLHVYHHCVVILLVWMWLQGGSVLALGLGAAFNTFVHVAMYWYYMQRSRGHKVWFKKYITSLQILQFASSFFLALPYLALNFGLIPLNPKSYPDLTDSLGSRLRGSPHGHQCTGWYAFLFAVAVNASFLALFIQFYNSTYKAKNKPKAQ